MNSGAPVVGVIGAGAMGGGVVASLLRARLRTHVRDLRTEAVDAAVRLGAQEQSSAAALAAACDVIIVLVVDAGQVEVALFGAEGAAGALRPGAVVMLSPTLDPDDVAAFAVRLEVAGALVLDAPVSGGPRRAHDGTMTLMVAGPSAAMTRCEPVFTAIAGKVFRVGTAPGTAARFKIVNNLLAAVNLAAAAEAMALARAAGLDPRQVVDVVNASSGGSWIFADRMPRALAGDYAPRAAARVLAKDVGIAAALAARLGVDAPFALAARAAFDSTVAAGSGEQDDAIVVAHACGDAPAATPILAV